MIQNERSPGFTSEKPLMTAFVCPSYSAARDATLFALATCVRASLTAFHAAPGFTTRQNPGAAAVPTAIRDIGRVEIAALSFFS